MKTLNIKKIIGILLILTFSLPSFSFAAWRLSQSNIDKISRAVDSIPLYNRRNYIEVIVARINTIEARTRISSLDAITKDRRISFLEEIKWVLMAKLRNLGNTWVQDLTPPNITNLISTYIANLQAWFSLNSSEAWRWYYVVFPSGSINPTPQQVISWAGYSWYDNANIKGQFDLMMWINTFNVSWLNPNTNYVLYFASRDLNWNMSYSTSNISFLTSNSSTYNTPPSSAFSVSWIYNNWAMLYVNSNSRWRWYFVVLPNWSWMPTSAQIRAWTDSLWTFAYMKWNFSLSEGSTSYNITGLAPDKNYIVYFVAEDIYWNLNPFPSSQAFFTTNSSSDAIPPVINASINFITNTSVTISMLSNEPGRWYYIVLPSWSNTPTSIQIRSWTDSNWNMVQSRWSFSILTWTNSFNAAWLNSNTQYVLYAAYEDLAWNMQPLPQWFWFMTSR